MSTKSSNKEFVKHLKVTNECAERGIKLVSDYAQSLTKSDEEREDMLQVVQAHRQFHPGQSKSSFLSIDTNLFSIWLNIVNLTCNKDK